MAPQQSIPLAANVLGLIGTIFWCIQLLPQIWKSHRTKSTEGLPGAMMFLWAASALPFGIYAIAQNFNVPLQVQPQLFCLFCTITWGQCLFYGKKWSKIKATIACIILLAVVGGFQVLFILVLRDRYANGVDWASDVVLFFGILACVMLLAGYVPIPPELIKRRGRMVGISLLFLTVDWSGAFFSLMSLVAQNTFDVVFGTLYALVVVIEGGMFISHGIWYLRTRHMRQKAQEAGVIYDEFPEAIAWQSHAYEIDLTKLGKNLIGPRARESDSEAR